MVCLPGKWEESSSAPEQGEPEGPDLAWASGRLPGTGGVVGWLGPWEQGLHYQTVVAIWPVHSEASSLGENASQLLTSKLGKLKPHLLPAFRTTAPS